MFLVRSQTTHMAYISTMRESPEALVEKSHLKCTQIQKNRTQNCSAFAIRKLCSQLQMCTLTDVIH